MVEFGQLADAAIGLLQQTLLDHLGDIGAGERHPVGEARLNLGEVVLLPLAHVADDGVHVLLRRHDDPGPAAALGVQALRDRLQVRHQLDVVGDVLADLVDEEVEAEVRLLLLVDIGLHLVGEVLDRRPEVLPIPRQDALAFGQLGAGGLRIGLGDVRAFEQRLFASALPRLARRQPDTPS